MRKGILPLLGLVTFIVMALTPTTSFAATSARTAKFHTPHFFPAYRTPSTNGSQVVPSVAHTNTNAVTNANPIASTNAASAGVLSYHGGPVMTGTSNVYIIFWDPNQSMSASYQSLISQYFNDVGNSPLYQNLKQYPESDGKYPVNAVLAGTWADTATTYSANPILDSDIQTEVTHAQNVKGWTSSLNNIFFVFTDSNEGICVPDNTTPTPTQDCTPDITSATGNFCAYHSFFGTNTLYAAMPYAASPNFNQGCNPEASTSLSVFPNKDDADMTINVTSHEEMEAATDPLISAWYVNISQTNPLSGEENGDLCAWTFGPSNAQSGDVVWNGHNYIVQQEWDNTINSCTLSSDHRARFYSLKNLNSNLVVDVSGGSKAAGASAIQWSNHLGANQQWDLVPVASFYVIVNRNSGLVLDAAGASKNAGTSIDQWSYNGGYNQLWILRPYGPNDMIMSANEDPRSEPVMYLDVYRGGLTNGTKIIQWTFNGGKNQQWNLAPIQPYYAIRNVNSGLVMDVKGGNSTAGANVIQWPYQGHNNQQWAVVADGTHNGTAVYQIVNLNSGLVLDVYGGQKNAGAQVIQWSNHNGLNQQWYLIADGTSNGVPIYLIRNVNSNLVMDVSGGGTTAGNNVIQWPSHNGTNQQWSLIATSA